MKGILRLSIIFFLIFTACGPSDEDKARVKIDQARLLLEKNDTLSAIKSLDSIPKLYPKAMYANNAAKKLSYEIQFNLLQNKENRLDSLTIKIERLEKPFEKGKSEFDRYSQYIHKRQNFKRAWDRSYIQVHLNEIGDIYLSSNYHGEKWLNHTSIRVYDQGKDAKTEEIPLDDVNNHRSDFMEAKWEKVSYIKGKDNGVIKFIAEHADQRLKAVFLGNRYYYIILETYDKQAVKDALALSKALKERIELKKEIEQLQNKLNIN